ncbi:MAG: transglycosylase domain-containing protein [Patescibacteria group bacterium]
MQQKMLELKERALGAWGSYRMKLLGLFSSARKPRTTRARSRSTRSRLSEAQRRLFTIKMARFAAVTALVLVIGGIVGFFALFAYYSQDLPKPGEVVRRSGFSTKIFARNGELLYDLYDEQRRSPISIDQVPEHLKYATVAIEDKDFYRHQGFDMMTIIRIPYNYIVRQRVVGGSTLTQQLVKNALLTNERSVTRKFKELVLSLQIERTFTKDEILEMYLNEAPYGGTAWGAGTAAELYFGKDISELTMPESAVLAGLPQRPSAYSPYRGLTDEDGTPLWKLRTLGVLRRMYEDKYITQDAYEESIASLDTMQFHSAEMNLSAAPHFVFYVRDLLADMYGEEVVETAGLQVTTSIDLELQQAAQEIVTEELEQVENLNITNGSVMVVDPRTGEILSMVGSKDFNDPDIDGQFNVAVDGLRQPGSSIKPVTYLTLLQRGYTPASMLLDVSTTFAANDTVDPYNPRNYDGRFRGPVSVRNSLGSSLNVPAVKALALVGVDTFLDQAYRMGFPTLAPTQENMSRFGLAVTLGGAEVHLIDIVSAYSAFANGGTKVEPVSILEIKDIDGRVLYQHQPVQGSEVMSEEEAFLISDILSDDAARSMAFGTGSQLRINDNVAVKTGTTNDQRDNWAIGWSQELMVGAWVGNNDNSPMLQVASGVSGATPIWRRVLLAGLERDAYGSPAWSVPAGIEQVEVDAVSGYPATEGFNSRTEYVVRGTLPPPPDPIHTMLKVCRNDEDRLANTARVAAGDYEEREFFVFRVDDPVSEDGRNRWQEAIDEWARNVDNEQYRAPTEYCGDEEDIFVRLREPRDERNYEETDIEIEILSDSGDGIEKVELYVNGKRREEVNARNYKGTITLEAGKHELYAIAYSESGEEKRTDTTRIGTGGVEWDAEDEDEDEDEGDGEGEDDGEGGPLPDLNSIQP